MAKDFNRALQWLVMDSDGIYEDINYNNGIYIYGAGELGLLALQYCEACNIPILGFLDQIRVKPVASLSGNVYPVFQTHPCPAKVDKSKCIAVAVATQPFHPIRNILLGLGWSEVVPFYHLTSTPSERHPLTNGWRLGTVNDEEIGLAREIFDRWADEHSRQHYEAFLAWHRNYTETDLTDYPIKVGQRYVIPEVLTTIRRRSSCFVDIGSHLGESIKRMTQSGLRFDTYHIFEPDNSSRLLIEEHVSDLVPPSSSAIIYPYVLSDRKRRVRFLAGYGYCSQMWEGAQDYRDSVELDSFALQPDLIKIHTEGSEVSVLMGSKATVKHSRPLIVFSVYHGRQGFAEDIYRAFEICGNYDWIFRLHSFQGTGAFVYGLPK